MKWVNLRELYPDAYEANEFVSVSDEVFEALCEFERQEEAFNRRRRRNKAYYSLDAGDGIESGALFPPQNPEDILIERETRGEFLALLDTLPKKQRRRIYEHIFLGMKSSEIALEENVDVSSVNESLRCGIKELTKCSNIFSD